MLNKWLYGYLSSIANAIVYWNQAWQKKLWMSGGRPPPLLDSPVQIDYAIYPSILFGLKKNLVLNNAVISKIKQRTIPDSAWLFYYSQYNLNNLKNW